MLRSLIPEIGCSQMEIKRIAVLGAGNGAHATAADLTLAGYKVSMFEFAEFKQNLEPLKKQGGIELDGASRKGFAKIDRVTSEMKSAVSDADLIIVVVPAYAHARCSSGNCGLLSTRENHSSESWPHRRQLGVLQGAKIKRRQR